MNSRSGVLLDLGCGTVLAFGHMACSLVSDTDRAGCADSSDVHSWPLDDGCHPHARNGWLNRIEVAEQESLSAILIGCDDVGSFALDLFQIASRRLTASGKLVLIDRPGALGPDSEGHPGRRNYLSAIGQRCGFDQLACVESGGHILLSLARAASAARWRLASAGENDLDSFMGLFERAFGARMDPELWRWKYAENRGAGVAAYRGGRMVAHYGGTRRHAVWGTRHLSLWQICDAMVDPPERGVMTKSGVMFLAAATFMELRFGLEHADYAFGFPSRRHEGLGERLSLYAEADRVMEVSWPVTSPRPRLATRIRPLDPRDVRTPAVVNALWARMRHDLHEDILVIRDWDYLRYRYIDHPTHHYDLLLVTSRWTGRPLGILVVRRLPESVELIDLITPLRSLPALIDQARRLAGRWGLSSLFCWITQAKMPLFLNRDATVRDIDVSMPISVWVPPEGGVDRVRGRWWLMSGDTDFH